MSGAYLTEALTEPVGVSTGKRRSVAEIAAIVEQQRAAYLKSVNAAGIESPTVDAVETTLGWDAIYDPERARVISPVSRDWGAYWGGYVLLGWDTFFAATLAGMGDKELAYANVIEELHEETKDGFVPNYARAGGWKSSDRSEPLVGSSGVNFEALTSVTLILDLAAGDSVSNSWIGLYRRQVNIDDIPEFFRSDQRRGPAPLLTAASTNYIVNGGGRFVACLAGSCLQAGRIESQIHGNLNGTYLAS